LGGVTGVVCGRELSHRKSLRSFDQGKPAEGGGAGDGLEGVGVSSIFLEPACGRGGWTGLCPETPAKGGLALCNPRLALQAGGGLSLLWRASENCPHCIARRAAPL